MRNNKFIEIKYKKQTKHKMLTLLRPINFIQFECIKLKYFLQTRVIYSSLYLDDIFLKLYFNTFVTSFYHNYNNFISIIFKQIDFYI